jgi:hypothetical protein
MGSNKRRTTKEWIAEARRWATDGRYRTVLRHQHGDIAVMVNMHDDEGPDVTFYGPAGTDDGEYWEAATEALKVCGGFLVEVEARIKTLGFAVEMLRALARHDSDCYSRSGAAVPLCDCGLADALDAAGLPDAADAAHEGMDGDHHE